jgi:hypothetical protein
MRIEFIDRLREIENLLRPMRGVASRTIVLSWHRLAQAPRCIRPGLSQLPSPQPATPPDYPSA